MILITGASGTVGTHLVDVLKAQGRTFRAAYHSTDEASKASRDGIDVVQLDFEKPETLRPALVGVDTVFLLGAGVRGQKEREANVVFAARAASVTRLVKQSIWRAPEEQFSLAKMHREIERVVEASGLAWTFLRPNGFMQNFLHEADSIKAKSAIFEPAANTRISHIDARDIASVAAKVLTTAGHEGKVYELSGPEGLSYGDAAEILSRVLGKKITYVAVTDDDARKGMVGAGLPDFYADTMVDLHRAYREGIASRVSSDVRNITGREPIAFEQFVLDHAGAFR